MLCFTLVSPSTARRRRQHQNRRRSMSMPPSDKTTCAPNRTGRQASQPTSQQNGNPQMSSNDGYLINNQPFQQKENSQRSSNDGSSVNNQPFRPNGENPQMWSNDGSPVRFKPYKEDFPQGRTPQKEHHNQRGSQFSGSPTRNQRTTGRSSLQGWVLPLPLW